jgi:hypothetical protein
MYRDFRPSQVGIQHIWIPYWVPSSATRSKNGKDQGRVLPHCRSRIGENAKECDGIGVQVKKGKAIKVQDEQKKLGGQRKKTTRNVILNRNHAA